MHRKIVSLAVALTLVVTQPLFAATVTILSPDSPQTYQENADISMSGKADWSDGGNSVDTVDLRVDFVASTPVITTDSKMVTVVKEPGPPFPTEGTWNTIELTNPLSANPAAAADTDEFDDYTLVARGLNASQGPFDPEAVDLLQITILPMED